MRFLVLLAAAAAVALSPGRAAAHDLRLVVKLPPESPTEVLFEAGFDDETPADGATITVTDASGHVVAEAKTDDRGTCKLPRPGPGKYLATIVAFGHRDRVEFEVAGPAAEYRAWRPDQAAGLAAGVAGLLLLSGGFWWRQRRRSAAGTDAPPVW